MDPRRLPGIVLERPFGRRATDSASSMRFYAAAFVAQVAGLSLPAKGGAGTYRTDARVPSPGLVTDQKA